MPSSLFRDLAEKGGQCGEPICPELCSSRDTDTRRGNIFLSRVRSEAPRAFAWSTRETPASRKTTGRGVMKMFWNKK